MGALRAWAPGLVCRALRVRREAPPAADIKHLIVFVMPRRRAGLARTRVVFVGVCSLSKDIALSGP